MGLGAIAVGDFNEDGKPDLVVGTIGFAGRHSLYAGNGDDTFQSPTDAPLLASLSSALASADFNGDGKLEVTIGFANMAAIALGNDDGTFQTALASLIQVYAAQNTDLTGGMALQTADCNLDGKPDARVSDYKLGVLTLVLNGGLDSFLRPRARDFNSPWCRRSKTLQWAISMETDFPI
ncbi:MAG: VCBS repeat-containing protein [Candidatus Acidiferrales bacterium]